jgi:hypothetical protein
VDVEDGLRVRVKGANGFAAASITGPTCDWSGRGERVRHQFGGGLLWVDLPEAKPS